MDDTPEIELQQVMDDVTDVSSQTDAIQEEGDADSEEETDEALAEAILLADSATNNQFVQVIQPEDIGDASDPDGAPVLAANCVCN